VTDSKWLDGFEQDFSELYHQHGAEWRERLTATGRDRSAGLLFNPPRGYRWWVIGLTVFIAAALVIVVFTYADPAIFESWAPASPTPMSPPSPGH
jgi:hypothetical protein